MSTQEKEGIERSISGETMIDLGKMDPSLQDLHGRVKQAQESLNQYQRSLRRIQERNAERQWTGRKVSRRLLTHDWKTRINGRLRSLEERKLVAQETFLEAAVKAFSQLRGQQIVVMEGRRIGYVKQGVW